MTSGPGTGGSALLGAAQWLEGLVQGPAATGLAMLAVATTGFLMLSGRVPVRRGLTVTLGCFILFGAPTIARGIVGSAATGAGAEPMPEPPPPSQPTRAFNPAAAAPPVTDPYAGASIR